MTSTVAMPLAPASLSDRPAATTGTVVPSATTGAPSTSAPAPPVDARPAGPLLRRARGTDDVLPFLENVTRGRGSRGTARRRCPSTITLRWRHHRSTTRTGADRGRSEKDWPAAGTDLPVYLGNRNWAPYVEDTVKAMRDDGIRRAAVFITSAWGGFSSCTQYPLEDIRRARNAAGPRTHQSW